MSHPFLKLLWLLMHVVAAPLATGYLASTLCSESVNRTAYRWIIDFEPGIEEYQSHLLSSGATFADSLGSSSFSLQVGR